MHPSEMDVVIRAALVEWRLALPVVLAVIVLGVIDTFMGMFGAWKAKKFESQKMREGMVTKAAMLLVMMAIATMDPFVPLPLTFTLALGFGFSQLVSVLENGGRLGIEIPKELFDRLVKLKGEKAPIRRKKKPPGPSID